MVPNCLLKIGFLYQLHGAPRLVLVRAALSGHWTERAPTLEIYTRAHSQVGVGGAWEVSGRLHWTPAALAVAPGANTNTFESRQDFPPNMYLGFLPGRT